MEEMTAEALGAIRLGLADDAARFATSAGRAAMCLPEMHPAGCSCPGCYVPGCAPSCLGCGDCNEGCPETAGRGGWGRQDGAYDR